MPDGPLAWGRAQAEYPPYAKPCRTCWNPTVLVRIRFPSKIDTNPPPQDAIPLDREECECFSALLRDRLHAPHSAPSTSTWPKQHAHPNARSPVTAVGLRSRSPPHKPASNHRPTTTQSGKCQGITVLCRSSNAIASNRTRNTGILQMCASVSTRIRTNLGKKRRFLAEISVATPWLNSKSLTSKWFGL